MKHCHGSIAAAVFTFVSWIDHSAAAAAAKIGFHPRNLHKHGYDFTALTHSYPALLPFIKRNRHNNEPTIDFSDQEAVLQLNAALLSHHYGIGDWSIPSGYLCPPVPSRVDYLHHVADLLDVREQHGGIRGLDIGTGANCIYPVLGTAVYGWDFVAVDTDKAAVQHASSIIDANPALIGHVEIRYQKDSKKIFRDILREDDIFDVTLCNPPFHNSLAAAAKGAQRKWRNLQRSGLKNKAGSQNQPHLNFGGKSNELCYPGGEIGFLAKMIEESADSVVQSRIRWFTTLISKKDNVKVAQRLIEKQRKLSAIRKITMQHGQKKSRIIAWSFTEPL